MERPPVLAGLPADRRPLLRRLRRVEGTVPKVRSRSNHQMDRFFLPFLMIGALGCESTMSGQGSPDGPPTSGGSSTGTGSLVIAVTEIQMPETHAQNNMPFILAGKARGRLQTQRWLKVPAQPHNNLLVSILNLFGLPNTRFGHQDYCTGPLSGLV
jgi:hypothetical protein